MIKILFLGASWGQISPIWHLQDSLDIEIFTVDNQPFKLILLPSKIPQKKYKDNEDNEDNEVVINFDESSKAWRKNKISLGEGLFRYK